MVLMDILRNVNRLGGERPYLATLVKVTDYRVGKPRSAPAVRLRILAKTRSIEMKQGRPYLGKYVTHIDFLNKKDVKVSCSCPDFWARWEYALHKRGAADIVYSNGEPPVVRNPRMYPGCCKHLIALTNRAHINGDVGNTFLSTRLN